MNPVRKIATLLKLALTPRCSDITKILSQQLDRPLPWLLRKRLEWHLAACDWCRRYATQIGLLGCLARGFSEQQCKSGHTRLSPQAADRIKKNLRNAKD
jgi:predicted anti-sigma-YlaC factor YlaD